MHLIFLGNSGDTGNSVNDPHQPHQVYAGLMLHESQCVAVNGEFNALCRRHFGSPLGESGVPDKIRPVDLFQGLGYFKSWAPSRRAQLIQDCLDIMIRRESPVIAAFMDKQQLSDAKAANDSPSALWKNPTEPIVSRFLFALTMFLDEMSMASMSHDQIMAGQLPVNDFALVVAQEGDSIEPRFMTEFLRSDEGMDATALLESFCYVSPENAVGAQLANLCAYFARRWLQNPTEPHPYFDILRNNKVIQVIYPVTV
jgi:hypothetical protein